ncbi:aromatic amino acid lyase [Nocardiopsis alba]|uniref:Aromatic amino acid lyase n=1 Tax=Nocardiopsis alba TaxID=53437 RepID=A0A7K2IR30_9ACTN|nr:aromatic amino acid ammonia-lyase [Nocardiopsis sp. LDBS1602]MEC3892628.1 aromatic amino acid ammonia-lyase [Nocardiopsis sp. LDBS1602]MYR32442.1 aromatic amino acid lyase [Nocardiopsis alba]
MQSRPPSLGALLRAADWEASIEADEEDVFRMRSSVGALEKALADGRLVYGMNRGYGALVEFSASESVDEQGRGLIAHLGTAQGQPLPADVSRLAVWIRLNSMRSGYSSVSPELWGGLADLWNRGFTPVIPRDGTVSASGDLQPLSSAASAFAGEGECWHREDDGTLVPRPAAEVLAELGADPVRWPAREALAFVNGTSVGLARTVHNHREVLSLLRVGALLTGRMATLLGADPVAYHPDLSMVRGQVGQSTVAGWIRSYMPESAVRAPSRPLQEPYSLRCAPQVLGAVLDQLDAMEPILLREAVGVTDNPVLVDGEVLHGGNFHAMPVALSSDQLGLCLQQVAFLADRQLSLLCTPETNGGLPPMLTPRPGAGSGLAGVQISTTSFVSRIRQLVTPASLTALPCNNGNQDHVPMALNGANAVSEAVEHAWNVLGSLAVGLAQCAALTESAPADGDRWRDLARICPPLEADRPLAAEVVAARTLVREWGRELVLEEGRQQ